MAGLLPTELDDDLHLRRSRRGPPGPSDALFVLGIPFWIASVAVYVLLGRSRSPRLAWTGGALLVAGLTMLAANLGTEIMTSFLVRQTTISPTEADQTSRTLSSPPAAVMNTLFLIGVGLGIPLTAASLWRSRAVPRTAAALLVAFLAIDLAGQSTGISALSVTAHVVAVVPASWIAINVLRMPPCVPNRLTDRARTTRPPLHRPHDPRQDGRRRCCSLFARCPAPKSLPPRRLG